MIRVRRALVAGAAVAGLLAACAEDPCADAFTCVRLDVDALRAETVDQLDLDVVYGGLHATTTTGRPGDPVGLPLSIPLTFDLPTGPAFKLDIAVVGKLGGRVVGADASSTTVQPGDHAVLNFFMGPVLPCTERELYCGGTAQVFREIQTLYRCTGGIPIFYARCSNGCSPHFDDEQSVCIGLGLCRDGGTYCGGHVLDGEPSTLYVCHSFDGITPTPCPKGCLVRGDGDDACA